MTRKDALSLIEANPLGTFVAEIQFVYDWGIGMKRLVTLPGATMKGFLSAVSDHDILSFKEFK